LIKMLNFVITSYYPKLWKLVFNIDKISPDELIYLNPSFVKSLPKETLQAIGINNDDSKRLTLQGLHEVYYAFLDEVTKRTARLVAQWQAVGFVHGVLNTDNMSVLGLTIDYGPFGFMDAFNNDFIPNGSDHDGRYDYKNQVRT